MKFEEMIRAGDFIVLDTETTGLRKPAEIVEIAIIDAAGALLLNQRIKPVLPIPRDAEAIHGISNAAVASAPGWAVIAPMVREIIRGRNVVIYNAKYDRQMLHLSDEAAGLPRTDYHALAAPGAFYCAMEWYAPIANEWDDYHESFRWQKLTTAIYQSGLTESDAHSALGDCQMTLALVRKLVK